MDLFLRCSIWIAANAPHHIAFGRENLVAGTQLRLLLSSFHYGVGLPSGWRRLRTSSTTGKAQCWTPATDCWARERDRPDTASRNPPRTRPGEYVAERHNREFLRGVPLPATQATAVSPDRSFSCRALDRLLFNQFFIAFARALVYAPPSMTHHNCIVIPPEVKKRLRTLATQDEDLLLRDREMWEQYCQKAHYRRIWEKLGKDERKLVKDRNPEGGEYDFLCAIAEYLKRPGEARNPFDLCTSLRALRPASKALASPRRRQSSRPALHRRAAVGSRIRRHSKARCGKIAGPAG